MKRLTKIMLVLALAFSAVSASASSVIRLLYAAPYDVSSLEGARGEPQYVNIYARVKTTQHTGGTWNADIQYREDPRSPWITARMSLRGHYGTHALYFVRIPRAPVYFRIRATWYSMIEGVLAARTYWETNDGANYYAEPHGDTTAGVVGGHVGLWGVDNGPVLVARAGLTTPQDLYDQWLNGVVFAQDLPGRRVVGIRMTINNWRTFTDVPCATSDFDISGERGSELVRMHVFAHRIQSRVTKPALTVKLAVRCQDLTTGQEYWDDNFGQYYTVRSGEYIQ